MAGRPPKTTTPRKAAVVRIDEQIVLELEVYAKLKQKSLSDLMGEQIIAWWNQNPEREQIRALVSPKEAPPKKKKSATSS